uniref:Uncharacterized protein n=1 Tax=Kalanchoe fedtschenkoi TaxID=63787 RepID=A0A7N0UZT7_KALFE
MEEVSLWSSCSGYRAFSFHEVLHWRFFVFGYNCLASFVNST